MRSDGLRIKRIDYVRGLRAVATHLLALPCVWQERAEMRQRLGQMDDRMLSDIGLGRGQADAEARKPFWRA